MNSLTTMKYKERYYEHYFVSATRWDKVIMSICLLASASSIAGWQIWDASPAICAVVLGIAQVVQAIRPILPFSIQISAIKHLLADGSALFVEYENEWLQLEALPDNDEKISRAIESHHRFEQSFFEIENKWTSGVYFPVSKWSCKQAEVDRIDFFASKYRVQ